MEANVDGTANLIAALGLSLKGKRFLFASSIAAVDRTSRPRGPLTEEDRPAPRSDYGRSKLHCEELIDVEAKARDFTATHLRLGTIYGPGQEKGGVVTLAAAAKAGGLAARLPWPGRISFGFVGDVAEAFWRLAEREEDLPGVFFVAEDKAHTMAELADELRRVQGGGKGTIGGIRWILSTANWFMWLPGIRNFAPWSLRAALADTIACDSGKLTAAIGMEWTTLADGLRATFGESSAGASVPAVPSDRPVKSLITGATGFLGSGLALDLAAAHGGENVIGLVRDPLPETEKEAASKLEAAGIRLVPCDLMTLPSFDSEGLDFDVLYHLAAETDSGASEESLAVNTVGTRNLLSSIGGGLRGKRIVLAGATASIDRCRRPTTLMKETDPECPRTGYGQSKLQAEKITANLAGRFGAAFVVPRFSPIWTADLSTGFLKAFREQVEGKSIMRRVLWPGRITMIRREDAAKILRHLGESGAADGGAVHIGDGKIYRYAALLKDLRGMAGDSRWSFPMPGFLWAFIRWCAWLPVASKVTPWRLSCLLGDDLAATTTRLGEVYPEPMLDWPGSADEVRTATGLGG
jgi:nucleoside-diphosphate-sugar epimerase